MGCAYGSVLASLGRTGELCEGVLASLGRTGELDAQCESVLVSLGRAYGECENKCNTLTISTKCHTSTVSSSAKPVFPSALLCDHFNCIRGAFVLLSAKLRDSSFSIDAETLVGNALIFMQSLPRCG
ncbi:hypothetical protein GN958_ATG07211 [Phytophthora infestans]|uniref:Uncharacterized protein n=1 Tax=Phytophthora infestans TaxID=4787 RepID=A0A8S9UZC0_PHYIN|nr:hypothetical protein GN958_ATG07211 [Phytophthora infestans]